MNCLCPCLSLIRFLGIAFAHLKGMKKNKCQINIKKLILSLIYTFVFLFSAFAVAQEKSLALQFEYYGEQDAKKNVNFKIYTDKSLKIENTYNDKSVGNLFFQNITQIFVPANLFNRIPNNKNIPNGFEFIRDTTTFHFNIVSEGKVYVFNDNGPGKEFEMDRLGTLTRFSWKAGLNPHGDKKCSIAKFTYIDGKSEIIIYNDENKQRYVYHDLDVELRNIRVFDDKIFGITSEPIELYKLFNTPSNANRPVAKASNRSDSGIVSVTEKIRKLTESDIIVKNEDGKEEKAWDIIKSSVTVLEAKEVKETGITERESQILEEIYTNLVKKEIGSVKLLGPAGSGKTHLIKLLISQIQQAKAPKAVRNSIYLKLNISSLTAGTKSVGSLDARVDAILELSKNHNIVWIVDEVHDLKGTGTHSGNVTNDIWQKLKEGLTEGYLRMIGMSTDFEWNEAYATDQPLNERFGKVSLVEPAGDDLKNNLRAFINKNFDPANKISIPNDVLNLIVRLSNEFNAMGSQPRKSTLLIEQIFAKQYLKNEAYSAPTIEEVKAAAQSLYNLHQDQFNPEKKRERLNSLLKFLDDNVVGQEPAKSAIRDSFSMSIAGIEDKTKPKGRKIFAGPKGQGKTELALAVGKVFGLPLARIMMTSFQRPTDIEDLKREVAQELRKNAQTVLFFDEFEKANPEVQKGLIDIFDKGEFVVREQKNSSSSVSLKINVRNAYAFMATNAGSSYIDSLSRKEDYNIKEMKEAMIRDGFNELVLDRTDGIVPFFYLSREDVRRVAFMELRKILKTTKENNEDLSIRMENLRGFIDQVVTNTYHERMSNRELLNELSKLRLQIADAINRGAIGASSIKIKLEGQRRNYMKNQCPNVFR